MNSGHCSNDDTYNQGNESNAKQWVRKWKDNGGNELIDSQELSGFFENGICLRDGIGVFLMWNTAVV